MNFKRNIFILAMVANVFSVNLHAMLQAPSLTQLANLNLSASESSTPAEAAHVIAAEGVEAFKQAALVPAAASQSTTPVVTLPANFPPIEGNPEATSLRSPSPALPSSSASAAFRPEEVVTPAKLEDFKKNIAELKESLATTPVAIQPDLPKPAESARSASSVDHGPSLPAASSQASASISTQQGSLDLNVQLDEQMALLQGRMNTDGSSSPARSVEQGATNAGGSLSPRVREVSSDNSDASNAASHSVGAPVPGAKAEEIAGLVSQNRSSELSPAEAQLSNDSLVPASTVVKNVLGESKENLSVSDILAEKAKPGLGSGEVKVSRFEKALQYIAAHKKQFLIGGAITIVTVTAVIDYLYAHKKVKDGEKWKNGTAKDRFILLSKNTKAAELLRRFTAK